MSRPYRPNTNPGSKRGTKERKSGHLRQESAPERKIRKREEAEDRNEAYQVESAVQKAVKAIERRKAQNVGFLRPLLDADEKGTGE